MKEKLIFVMAIIVALHGLLVSGCSERPVGVVCLESYKIPKYESPIIAEVDGKSVYGEPQLVGEATICKRFGAIQQ